MDFDLYAYKDYRTDPKTKRRAWRGTWFYAILLPAGPDGRRPQREQRGFATKGAALRAGSKRLTELLSERSIDDTAPVASPQTPAAEPRLADAAVRAAAQPKTESSTLEEYLERWLKAVRTTVDETTWKTYRTGLRTYIIRWIGYRHMSLLTDDDLSTRYGDLLARGSHRRCVKKGQRCEPVECENGRPLSRTTVRLAHRILHKALFDAYKILPVNPADHARIPKKSTRAMTAWAEEELQRFLVAMADDRLLAAWYLALTAGLRRGELAGLRGQACISGTVSSRW